MGGMDYNTVIRNTIKELSKAGVEAISYPSGRKDSLEVAVRRATVTGANQTALKLQEIRADEMDCDLVETSAHSGARPSHAEWQGGIYSRSGKSRKYESLVEATRYGYVDGLGGANCSHSFRPWFEGMSRTWSKERLEEYRARDFEYNGEKLTEYEVLQEQRKIERSIRRWKREENAMQAAGLDAGEAKAKVREWNGRLRDFTEQTGLKPDGTRVVVGNMSKNIAKDIAESRKIDIIKEKSMKVTDTMTELISLGKINTAILEEEFGKILCDDIIVTSERIRHIKERHPEDYALFEEFGRDAVANPDVIIRDQGHEGTVFMVKKMEKTNLNVVVRVVLETDNPEYKNSVMTFYRLRDRNLKNWHKRTVLFTKTNKYSIIII